MNKMSSSRYLLRVLSSWAPETNVLRLTLRGERWIKGVRVSGLYMDDVATNFISVLDLYSICTSVWLGLESTLMLIRLVSAYLIEHNRFAACGDCQDWKHLIDHTPVLTSSISCRCFEALFWNMKCLYHWCKESGLPKRLSVSYNWGQAAYDPFKQANKARLSGNDFTLSTSWHRPFIHLCSWCCIIVCCYMDQADSENNVGNNAQADRISLQHHLQVQIALEEQVRLQGANKMPPRWMSLLSTAF